MAIQKFYTVAQSIDFHRNFQFKLTSFGNINFGQNQLVYVETATLPGKSLNSVAVPYMGLQFNVPGTVSYPGSDGWTVQFRCDGALSLRSTLEEAIRKTWDDETSSGNFAIPNKGSTVRMELLGKNNDTIKSYILHGVFVKTLGDAAYDIKDAGTVQTVSATLAYQYWRIDAQGGKAVVAAKDNQIAVNQISVIGNPWGGG